MTDRTQPRARDRHLQIVMAGAADAGRYHVTCTASQRTRGTWTSPPC